MKITQASIHTSFKECLMHSEQSKDVFYFYELPKCPCKYCACLQF